MHAIELKYKRQTVLPTITNHLVAMTQKLTTEQIEHFHDLGYLITSSGLDDEMLNDMDAEIDSWIEESRTYEANYGETMDGKARFDLEEGHCSQTPKLRRVANPVDVSEVFQRVLWDSPVTDMVAQLIGPSIKFHHCKLNIKLPKMDTVVYYHQDHSYDPHTNDDMLAILLMLDESTPLNGCLKIVPGSHKKRYSHFQDNKYVGLIDPQHYDEFNREAIPVTAKRGEICFMHTWSVHGSESNRSSKPRRLLICDYASADAFPLLSPAVPSPYTGMIVRGKPSPYARLTQDHIEIRTPYSEDSFFGVQGQPSAT